jgi:hypothetical protein
MSKREPGDGNEERIGAVAGLPRAIEPSRDLWPGIARRIAAEPRDAAAKPAWRSGRMLRAAVVALALLGGGVMLGRYGTDAPLQDAAPNRSPSDAEWANASLLALASLEDSTRGLDPATAEIVRRNLEIIDDAVREIRVALESDPTNPRLQKFLTAEYRRRSALLRRAVADSPM